jgi:hypothetical protein
MASGIRPSGGPGMTMRLPKRRSGFSELASWLPAAAARLQATIELNTTRCAISSKSAASFRKILDTVVAARSYKISRRSPHFRVLSIHGVKIMQYECGNSRIVIAKTLRKRSRPNSIVLADRTGLYLQLWHKFRLSDWRSSQDRNAVIDRAAGDHDNRSSVNCASGQEEPNNVDSGKLTRSRIETTCIPGHRLSLRHILFLR